MAECSESAGSSFTPCFAASGKTAGPPAISVSLLARQMSFPARMAAHVGWRPAHPTMPVTTASASRCAAAAIAPSSPVTISGCGETPLISSLNSATFDASCRATSEGLNCRVCWASSSMLPPAESATISNLSACSAAMPSVWVPMEPVEPRTENLLGGSPGARALWLGGATARPGQAGGGWVEEEEEA